MKIIKPPFKTKGSKHHLVSWILGQFPENHEDMHYLEPYCGTTSLILNKQASKEELINDIDGSLIGLLRIIRDKIDDLVRGVKKIKYKECTFNEALEKTEFENETDFALNEFILRIMSRGGMKQSWSNKAGSGWKTDLLSIMHERLQNVCITNKSAIDILKTFDDSNVLCYCDPPKIPDSKEVPSIMTVENHMELADILNNFKGKVVVSGHPSRLYNRLYKSWNCETKKITSQKNQIKIEILWRNF